MLEFLGLLIHVLAAPFRTQAQLEAEITLLRHQLNVLQREASTRPHVTAADRLLFVWLCRLFPSLRNAITIVQPDTVLRWHRSAFRLYWRWKSRSGGGRPKVPIEVRTLIRRMSVENPLWGAPRIHGELLKLGIEVAQSTVAKYMAKSLPGGSGQTWKTFLRNHAAGIGAMDFLGLPTINSRLLFILMILRHERRRLISLMSTARPLKVKLELRAMTNNDLNRESAVMISSTMPSAKYSCSGSPLMFWNGSTAIEGFSGNCSGVGADCNATAGLTGTSGSAFARQSNASQCTLNAPIGRSMFFSERPPKSSNVALTRPATASRTLREIRMPPAGASPSNRAATLTPSP
jgi:hypothetical protein